MTATATIDIARRNGVSRVPNTALRFRPTAAMFAALGQAQPTTVGARSGGARSGGARSGGARSGGAGAPAASARAAGRLVLVWAWAGRSLAPITLSTGITDGSYTEILSGAPTAETQLVTTFTLPASANSTSSTASPLLQQNGPPPGMPPPGPPPGGPR
jgi:HlyD family secretion protein